MLWRNRLWRLLIIAAAIATVVVALLGGFRRADATGAPMPVSGPGTPLSSDAFTVTPLCAFAADRRPGQPVPRDGERFLVLRAKVESRSKDWLAMRAYLDKDVVWLPQGHGDPVFAERSQRADDATLGYDLGPGLPVLVDFVWELPADAAMPTTTSTWGLFKRHYVARSHASGEGMWLQDGPGWKFSLPVSATCPGGAA